MKARKAGDGEQSFVLAPLLMRLVVSDECFFLEPSKSSGF